MALADVVDLLRCPHCATAFDLIDRTLRCLQGHAFDVARQGYVNLLPGPPPKNADTAVMVAARDRFLSSGHYDAVLDGLFAAIIRTSEPTPSVVIDTGAGPAWYLAELLDRLPRARGLATDVSVPAVRRAARRHPRMAAIVADSWTGLPIADGVADLVLSVFAPRNPSEAARILRPGGHLIVLAAEPDHLAALRTRLGLLDVEPGKHQRLLDSLPAELAVTTSRRLTAQLHLPRPALADLVAMGPNAFHAHAESPDQETDVTVAVRITTAQRQP